jgi:replicative DNA helicase
MDRHLILEVEKSLLGKVVHETDLLLDASAIVVPRDFLDPKHKSVFEAALWLTDTEGSVTPLTVEAWLSTRNTAVSREVIDEIFSNGHAPETVEDLARIIKLESRKRTTLVVSRRLSELSQKATNEDEIVAFLNNAAMHMAEGNGDGGPIPVSDFAGELFTEVHDWIENPIVPGQVRGLSTYIRSLDLMLGGCKKGEVIGFAARPSVGKSALVGEIALRMALNGHRVLFFALEMTKAQIMARWAASRSGVETDIVKRGRCPDGGNPDWYATEEQLGRYVQHVTQLAALDTIYIDDSPDLTIAQIRARANSVGRRLGGLDLIVIDTGNLIKYDGIYTQGVKIEGAKSAFAKALAKECSCTVFFVWQLNRALEGRQDRRPELHDLRDSGEVEQNLDRLIALYRESYYARTEMDLNQLGDRRYDLELLALKQRDGARHLRRTIRYYHALHQFHERTGQTE